MENANQGSTPFEFDFAPALKLYAQSMQSWKDGYEALLQQTQMGVTSANTSGQPYEQAAETFQRTGEAVFKRFIEQQIEICRFFERRFERYLDLPDRLARCRNPVEVAQLEMDFFNRMATEYAEQGMKLMKPFNELAMNATSGRMTY